MELRVYADAEALAAAAAELFRARRAALHARVLHRRAVPSAPPDGYFWRQIRNEFVGWAGVPPARCRPFAVDAADLDAMCKDYERAIAEAGGLDLVMLGLGPNAHIASHEPPADFSTQTCPVRLIPDTVAYILTDDVIQGEVCDRAVTLGVQTILSAREVVVL